ncbi:6-phosphofructokinase [bacterium]|nr:6-phosphofructokinase [bacterium]
MKCIGIMTGGGDCGGLNAVIKGAAEMANTQGIKAFMIPNGYAGLYNLVNIDSLVEVTPSRVDDISVGLAGSEAGHSRVSVKEIKNPRKYSRIKKGLAKFGLEGLVISGGDDTGTVMVDLHKHGIKAVHAPKTMDLDLMPYSVGGDSTINRIREFGRDLATTGRSHNRIIVLEVFGRYAGHTAFRGGVAADADAILIPEIPVDFQLVWEHIKKYYFRRIRESDINAGTYLVVVAEGLMNATGEPLYDKSVPPDAMGHQKLAGAGKYVCQELDACMKEKKEAAKVKAFMRKQGMYVPGIYEAPEIRAVVPQHLVRCGFTSAYDVKFGLEAGAGAVLCLQQDIIGVTVTGITKGEVTYMKTEEAIEQRFVDLDEVALYENLGFCFGRTGATLEPTFQQVSGAVPRIYV